MPKEVRSDDWGAGGAELVSPTTIPTIYIAVRRVIHYL